ncbi:MAG TPA: extracellular solute-binding protein, partial [Patescibacteria group bacterium]|nr:extracellular solute-binding protein [Patescibacteria group bacterium]
MIQNGAEMTTENGDPSFQLMPPNLEGRDVPPGVQALGFYTDFANPNKENYTWNSSQPNSLDAFLQGRSAFFFGYSYHLPQIRVGAPRLNLGISKLPQIEGNPVKNFANYWYFAVSKKTQHADIAWNLLNFLIKPDESKKVLDVVKRPAAQKAQLASQMDDEDVGVFASEVLTATSWYRGNDPQTMENALLSMIESVVAGTSNAQDAARLAADKIGQTIH